MDIRALLKPARAIPVMTVTDKAAGVDVAKALVAGGLKVLEIALRTAAALAAVEAIAKAVPEATVGVGTLLNPEQFPQARNAGAKFAVSPGLTPMLAQAGKVSGLAYLPSAITPSEVMAAREWGYTTLKFFPCKAAGGIDALKNFQPVFPDTVFCPTGGLTADDFRDYLAQPNVICTGGTWMMPAKLIEAKDWRGIEALARRCAA
jgi:2-dehydro-3-deoxyphosphogluconate aldolase/(4S)-4-hydroxy-2-oxoglutarate aldolase